MHIYFEPLERPASFSDCKIGTISWMGRVSDAFLQSWNDDQQLEDNWKFNHIKYYEEGWLATGNQRGIVGVTYTSCKCPSKLNKLSMPFRTNYNLRGHRSEIKFVKWNEPFQKLATVDSNGTIFVWIKADNRWSIELINDREVQVVDFNWSHDGRMALITYLDGFILIGSVAGQRYWSSLLNLESNQMTTSCWSPDDRQVLIGVSNGSFLVLNLNGAILAEFVLKENVSVTKMAWSVEKFKLDEDQDVANDPMNDPHLSNININVINLGAAASSSSPNRNAANLSGQSLNPPEFRVNSPMAGHTFDTEASSDHKDESLNSCFRNNYRSNIMAICFEDGWVYLLRSAYDDPFPVKINTKLIGIQMEWSNKGEVLAVGGHLFNMVNSNRTAKQPYYMNVIKFYCGVNGHLRYIVNLNYTLNPITALTWGHNDRRLFVATGNCVHIAWVTKKMPKLQLLSRLAIKQHISREQDVKLLQLPASLRILIRSLFIRTLRCYLPDLNNLRDFVINAPPTNMRYYCTLIRHVPKDRDARSKLFSTYIMYLEYLGGLIPILKGKRTSKLKPEFIIYDPQAPAASTSNGGKKGGAGGGEMFVFENYFNKFENRRSSTRRIAYYVPTAGNSAVGQQNRATSSKTTPKVASYMSASESEDSEDGEQSQAEQPASGIEISPSTFYQSFLRRNLYRKSKMLSIRNRFAGGRQTNQPDETDAGQMPNSSESNGELNGSQNNLNASLNNHQANNEPNEHEADELNTPLILTLLGHNPIVFTRRRAINNGTSAQNANKKLCYIDEMPENKKFILITSNIFGTKFKFLGLTSWLPSSLGCISYKTSLLHLQPRQMQLNIKEMAFSAQTNPNSSQHNLKERITENVLKSCESNSDFNNLDEDVEWNNSSFDDEYIKTIPVAPLSPQFLNVSNLSSNKLNSPMEFSSIEDYLTFQIDPSSEQINCNLTFSSNPSNNRLNCGSPNEFCSRHAKDENRFLRSVQPATTITNSVSTQTSFPSLNHLNTNQSQSLLMNNEDDEDGLNTMNTLASCSRLIHSSSMICPGRNANQCRGDFLSKGADFRGSDSDGFTKRLIDRKSLDLGLQRRLTLKNTRRPLSCYSLKLDNRTKCILNCMYLDEEALVEENGRSAMEIDRNDEFQFDDLDDALDDEGKGQQDDEKQLLSKLNQMHSSNESLLESYCFDDQTSNRMVKEDSDLSCLSDLNRPKWHSNNQRLANVPSTPVHKRKQFSQSKAVDPSNNRASSFTERTKDLNNNRQKAFRNAAGLPFYSNDSFDESESDEIQVIGQNNASSKLSNSASDLLIEQSELNEERRKNEINDRISLRSENYRGSSEFNASDLRGGATQYVNMSNNSRLSFINRSLPATPLKDGLNKNPKRSFGKALLYSPVMIRKAMKQKFSYLDCSSDDDRLSDDDDPPYTRANGNSHQDSPNRLKKSVKQTFCLAKRHSLNKVQPNNDERAYSLNNSSLKELIMRNKAPVWNELSQVYQLDFGGRVTQESAKNFQIEYEDKQVLQFGRIDLNGYTLDFQQPFTPIQALSVALANLTQRLK